MQLWTFNLVFFNSKRDFLNGTRPKILINQNSNKLFLLFNFNFFFGSKDSIISVRKIERKKEKAGIVFQLLFAFEV